MHVCIVKWELCVTRVEPSRRDSVTIDESVGKVRTQPQKGIVVNDYGNLISSVD